MTTLNPGQIKKPSFIKRFLTRLAEKKLPKRVKRMMYISSIIGLLCGDKNPDLELIAHLNDIFQMAQFSEAVKLPFIIKDAIWSDVDVHKVVIDGKEIDVTTVNVVKMSYHERSDLAEYFAKNVPSWIKYDDIDKMKTEIYTLLSNFQLIIPETETA